MVLYILWMYMWIRLLSNVTARTVWTTHRYTGEMSTIYVCLRIYCNTTHNLRWIQKAHEKEKGDATRTKKTVYHEHEPQDRLQEFRVWLRNNTTKSSRQYDAADVDRLTTSLRTVDRRSVVHIRTTNPTAEAIGARKRLSPATCSTVKTIDIRCYRRLSQRWPGRISGWRLAG